MKSLKRCLVVLFASFLFVTSTLTVNVLAEDTVKTVDYGTISYVNPLYEGVFEPKKVEEYVPDNSQGTNATSQATTDDSYETYTSVDEAAVYLRNGMKTRQDAIRFNFVFTAEEDEANTLINSYWHQILDKAVEHTGNLKEGDNLRWQYGGMNEAQLTGTRSGNEYTMLFTYLPVYYTTAAQEAELDSAIANLLNSLDLASKTDYQKVKAIYDYMCANIVYDHTNLNNSEYTLKYTAYAALINKTSVCQGYANLLYRLLLEQGIDVRIIAGLGGSGTDAENHAWNIIKLNGLYYNADSTWDAGSSEYSYFLKSMANFPDHQRNLEGLDIDYTSEEFNTTYPMSDSDFSLNDAACISIEEAGLLLRQALMNREGSLTVSISTRLEEGETIYQKMGTIGGEISRISTDFVQNASNGYLPISYDTGASSSYSDEGDHYVVTFSYEIKYTLSEEQDRAWQQKSEDVVRNLGIEGKNDYEKILAIYTYVTENIEYSHEASATSYINSAYGALVENCSKCNGISQAIYFLSQNAGVDCELIGGRGDDEPIAHAWNIVEIDGLWYNVDATWDLGRTEFLWFLQCDDHFTRNGVSHARYPRYDAEFFENHPMSPLDYGDTATFLLAEKDYDVTLEPGESFVFVFRPEQLGRYTLRTQNADHKVNIAFDVNSPNTATAEPLRSNDYVAVYLLEKEKQYRFVASFADAEQSGSFALSMTKNQAEERTITNVECALKTIPLSLGTNKTDLNNNTYVYYDSEPLEVTVTFNDGESIHGTPTEVLDALKNMEIETEYEIIGDDQAYGNEWSVGTYHLTLRLNGFDAPYDMEIVNDPIQSVEVKDYPVIYDNEYYAAPSHYKVSPLEVIVTTADNTYEGAYETVRAQLYEDLGILFPEAPVVKLTASVGVRDVSVKAFGVDTTMKVDIRKNPIKSISNIEGRTVTPSDRTTVYDTITDENGNKQEVSYQAYPYEPTLIAISTTDNGVFRGTPEEVLEQLRNELDYVGSFEYSGIETYENYWEIGNHTVTVSLRKFTRTYTVVVEEDVNYIYQGMEWESEAERKAKAVYVNENDPDDIQYVDAELYDAGETPATCTDNYSVTYEAVVTAENSLDHQEHRDYLTYEEANSALGHDYYTNWNWSPDYQSAFVTLTCNRCGDQKELSATVTSEPGEDDTTVFTATAVDGESGTEYTSGVTAVNSEIPVIRDIYLDSTLSTEVSNYNQHDYYRFTPEENGLYCLEIISEEAYASFDFYASDHKNDYVSYVSNSYINEHKLNVIYSFTAGNTYVINVGSYFSGSSYQITMKQFPETESVSVGDVRIFDDQYYMDEYWVDDVRHTYKRYNYNFNSLELIMEDGNTFSGTYSDVQNEFLDTYGMQLLINGPTDDQSYENQWTLGTHEAHVEINGIDCLFHVTVALSPIQSVEASDRYVYSGDGYRTTEWDQEIQAEVEYFVYYADPRSITVHTDNGDYTGDPWDVRYQVYEAYGAYYDINVLGSDQSYTNQWTAGTSHEMTLMFGSHAAPYTVYVENDPVTSVTIADMSVSEDQGSWSKETVAGETRYVFYNQIIPQNITVKMSDGEVKTFETESEMQNYLSDKYNRWYGISLTDNYKDLSAGTHVVSFTVGAYNGTFNLEVLPSQITSVTVNGPVTVYDGQQVTGYDYSTGEEIRYQYYSPEPREITVLVEGEEITGSIEAVRETLNSQYGINAEYFIETEQSPTVVWETGNTYTATFYFGRRSADYEVKVEPDLITEVTVRDTTAIEGTGHSESYDFLIYSDTPYVTLKTADRTFEGPMYQVSSQFYDVYGYTPSIEWNLRDLQIADEGWHVGETHTVTFKMGTVETTYLFTIIENPISSFTIDPIRIIIGTGYTNYDADDQPYMHYNINPVSGEVVLKNGDILSGTVSEISEELSGRYGNAEFQLHSVDDQYNNHWTEPGTYTVEFFWAGVSSNGTVNLITDLISSITAEGCTYFLGDTTTFYNGDSSHEGYQYVPKMVTVTMSDGASFTGETGKVTDWLVENYDYHVNVYFDTEIPSGEWTEPGDYKCFVHYGNVTGEYYTHVIANPIEDMIINNVPMVKMLGDTYNDLYENGHSFNGYSVMPTSITLIFNDGHETLTGYPYDLVQQLRNEYNVSLSYPQLTTGQYETPWETADEYPASLKFGPVTRKFTVIIKENLFESISVEDMVYYDGDQEFANWEGVRFRMYPVYPNEITVKMKDKEKPYTGATNQVLQQISTDYGLGELYLNVRHDQNPDNVWTPGVYEVSVSLEGVSTTMNVEIKESPVASVEVDDIKVIYGKKQLRRYDQETGTEYYVYNTNPVNVRVTLKSGEFLSGQLYRVQNDLARKYDGHQFRIVIDDDGQTVDSEEWEVGSVHQISAYVFGVYTTYECEVIDHPIISISFDDFTIKEGNGYTDVDENGNQYIRYFSTPKHVIIETYDGKIHEADSIFDLGQIMETDYSLPFDYPIVEDGQSYETPWVLGGTYDVTATAYDKSGSYKVTIVENPIRSIEAEDFSIVFGDKTDNRVDSTGYSFYECYNTTPLRIKVTMNDGRVLEGSFEDVQRTLMEEYFDNDYVYYDVYDDQAKDTEWQLGEHEVRIRMGTCTDTYKVNIVTGDFLTGLSCSDYSVIEGAKKDIESLDRRDGMKMYYTVFGYDADDTTVTVTVNGQPFTGTPEEVTAYLKEKHNLSVSCEFYDGQGRESWGVGEHTVTMEMAGLQTTYKVNVIPNPIKSLSTNDVEIEASDYEMDGTGAFRVYHFDSDSVTVELENETIQGTVEAMASELNDITGADVLIDYVSGQSLEHPWHPGNDYPAYVIAFSHGAEFMRYEYTVTILSNYEVVKWNWAEDGSSASVTLRQKDTGDVLDIDAEVTLKTEAPTCTADGKLIYTAYVLYDNEEFTDTLTLKGEDALGHDWGEASYEWIETEEGYNVHASATCARCEEVLDETATAVYSITKEATCTEEGSGLYTAEFTNDVFETQTKETVIEALGHHYVFKGFEWSENSLNAYGLFECERGDVDVIRVSAIVTETVREAATCETDGYITYTASLNADECPDHMAHEDVNTVVLGKTGHEWTFRNISWTKTDFGYEAEANYVCAHDGTHTNAVEADVTEKRTPATCEEDGSVVYTASVTEEDSLDGKAYSDEKTEVLKALGHDWEYTQMVWSGNDEEGYTASASFTCRRDHEHTQNIETTVTETVVEPTCETEGSTTYTAVLSEEDSLDGQAHTEEKVTAIVPALGHIWHYDGFTWIGNDQDGYTAATADFSCERDTAHVEHVAARVTVDSSAECGQPDTAVYTAVVSKASSLDGEFHNDVRYVEGGIVNHIWKFNKFVWEEDGQGGYTAKAEYICTRNSEHKETVEAEVTSSTVPATCEEAGSITYTASVTVEKSLDGVARTEEKAVEIPATGHDWDITYIWSDEMDSVEARAVCRHDNTHKQEETAATTYSVKEQPTCEEEGTGVYTAVFENTIFKTQTREVPIEALGHDWNEATYEWSADNKTVTAKRVCKRDASHIETETVNTTSKVTVEPACETKGKTTYTAVFENTAFAAQTKEVEDIEALGHDWNTPTYTWSEDLKTVTAKHVCKRDDKHVEEETVSTTSEVTKQSTCEDKGETTYTAVFANEAFTKQTKTVENIEALGHDWNEATYEWSSDNKTVTAKRVCKNEASHVETETVNTTSKVTVEPTCETKGKTAYTAAFKNEAFKEQSKEVENIDALGHDYGEPVWNWSDDLASATAVFTCKRDNSHTEEVKAEVVTVKEEEDKFLYTAKVTFNGKDYTDTKEVKKEAPPVEEDSVIRLSGRLRYDTSLVVADELKSVLGIEKFDTVILATGEDFADALGGGYLAAKKSAPIILTKPTQKDKVNTYINENLTENGTVYVLGGEGAVPASCLEGLNTSNIVRLSGRNRYVTNLAILNEAGVDKEDILIVTGTNYADSLAASATGLPMLLVNGKNTSLNDQQRSFLSTHSSNAFYIIGGTGAVSSEIETDISSINSVNRLSGRLRFDTSVLIAETFFSDPDKVILSYSHNFPDGLSGGPLAYALKSPVLLTRGNSEKAALDYVSSHSIKSGYLCGGEGVLPDTTARIIFSMTDTQEIVKR